MTRPTRLTALILIVLCALALPEVTGRPVVKDAAESLRIALNVAHHDVYSEDEQPPYGPTMVREPVPILVTAASIRLVDAALGPAAPEAYFSGDRARYLKLQNLLWLALLMASAAWAAHCFGLSRPWQLLAALAVELPFTLLVPPNARYAIGVDSLCTELPGAAILCCASTALTIGFTRRSLRMLALASGLFGLLALTKAGFFYAYPPVLVCLAVLYFAVTARARWLRTQTVLALLVLVLPFAALSIAWMARNEARTGYFQMAERGGPIVLYRGLLDGMNGREYAGSFYAWAATGTVAHALRLITGFRDADLEAGGRLQHLAMGLGGAAGRRDQESEDTGRPEEALTWYRESRATYERYLRQERAAGARYAPGAADKLTQQDGFKLIERRLFMHFALFAPLLLRGAMVIFPLLILTLVYARAARRADLAVFILPALWIVLFYAMITHFVQRYGWLPRPASTIALVIIAAELWRHGWPRNRAPARSSMRVGAADATQNTT